MLRSWRRARFLRRLEELLERIRTESELQDTSADDRKLDFVMQRLAELGEIVRSGDLPPRRERYGELSYLIIDQWPLGDPLGSAIMSVEHRYRWL